MLQRRLARWTDKLVHNLLKLPAFRESCLRRIGTDESLLVQSLRQNVNQNDLALYNLLHTWRILRENAAQSNVSLRGKHVLEIGTSKLPGLPLVLLLEGCEHFFANNIFAVNDWLPGCSAELITAFLRGMGHCGQDRVARVLQWEQTDQQHVGHLRSAHFTNLSPLPAEAIDLPDNSVDVVFSLAVFEHLSDPLAVLENAFRIVKPGGWCFHAIDLRDHRDFGQPLEFLKLDERAYRSTCPRGENRWRASDFLRGCTETGWKVERTQFVDQPLRLAQKTSTDAWCQLQHEQPSHTSLADFKPWVTDQMRAGFAAPFSMLTLEDLSVLSMSVCCRKPISARSHAA